MNKVFRNAGPLVFFICCFMVGALIVTPGTAEDSPSSPLIIISDIAQSPAEIVSGETFTEDFTLRNVGNEEAKMVQLSLNISYPFAIVGSSSNFYVGNLISGGNRSVRARISVDKNALVGVYSIPYMIIYIDSAGASYGQSGTFGVKIFGKPQLLVDSISVDPPSLHPGESGFMTVRLVNVGTDVAVNASMKILGGNDIVGSSFAHIAKIDSKQVQSILFPISVNGKLEPGTYLLNITVAYRDDSNNAYHLSKLYEFEISPVKPFIPVFYMAVAAGSAALALAGYFIYAWKPEALRKKPNKSSTKSKGKNESSKKKRKHMRMKVLLVSCVAVMYVLLLIPYLIHANLGNAGVVIHSNEIMLESLPEDVQEVCRLRGFVTPVVLLVKHLKPEWVTMVVTSEKFSLDTVVEMSDYVVDWRVDWRDFNFLNLSDQTFERFAIANVRQLGSFESSIEIGLFTQPIWRVIYELSKIDFYAGPVLVIFCLTVLLQEKLALWNLPAIFACYSLQVWRLNAIAYEHHVHVPAEWESFGYFFIVLIPLALFAWHFERSRGGRPIAEKMKALSQALGLSKE